MKNATNEPKGLEKNLAEGYLHAVHTRNGWFFKVYPAYNILKVKISFVLTGTNGQSFFDLFFDITEFNLLADEILSGRLKAAIDAERQMYSQSGKNQPDYPDTWKKTKFGPKGSKTLQIGVGKNSEVCIYAKDSIKQLYALVPCTYNDLLIIANMFKLSSRKCFEQFADAIVKRSEAYHYAPEDYVDSAAPITPQIEETENTEPTFSETKPTQEAFSSNTLPTQLEPGETKEEPTDATLPIGDFRVTITGKPKKIANKGYKIPAVTSNNEDVFLMLWLNSTAMKQLNSKKVSLDKFIECYSTKPFSFFGKKNTISFHSSVETQLTVNELIIA